MAKRRRYQPLVDALVALPAGETRLTFTLAELEALLGQPLPATAKAACGYWYSGSVAESNWLACGFTVHVNRRTHTLTFVRQEEDPDGRSAPAAW